MDAFVEYVASLGFWSWLILALILMAMETVVPGVHFLWFGLAAFAVGLIVAIATEMGASGGFSLPWQMVTFALLSVATVFGVKQLAGQSPSINTGPDMMLPGTRFIGHLVIVEDAISAGRGKVRAADTVWLAEGEDAPRGARVRVTGVNNTALVVSNDIEDDA